MTLEQPVDNEPTSATPNGPVETLLIEDQPHDAELILRALEGLQQTKHVVRVADGAQALDFLFGRGAYEGRDVRNQPKLVLLDLKLPRVSGLEVLEVLKSDDRLQAIPVVVLTSSKEERDVERAYTLGVNSYVVKPVEYSAFTQTIQQIATYWLTVNELPD